MLCKLLINIKKIDFSTKKHSIYYYYYLYI